MSQRSRWQVEFDGNWSPIEYFREISTIGITAIESICFLIALGSGSAIVWAAISLLVH